MVKGHYTYDPSKTNNRLTPERGQYNDREYNSNVAPCLTNLHEMQHVNIRMPIVFSQLFNLVKKYCVLVC